jgi:selenocysteine-specific translation elongation factor
MKSVNFVVLGDASIADELGKKGSSSNITLYDRKSSDRISTFVVPSSFPEKVQSLVQSIALAEHAILNVKSVDKSLGEQIVALDSAGMTTGFILAEGMEDDVRRIVQGTVLENYKFVTLDEMKRAIDSTEPARMEGPAKILIDASFDVKGVGAVLLGVVRRGVAKKHAELELMPGAKSVSVRSIQMHDDDVESADAPARVGLAVKGVEAKDVERGDVIAEKKSLKSSSEIKIKFVKSKFYRGEINSSSTFHLCVGLQIKPVKIAGAEKDEISVSSERPLAYESGEVCVLVDLNSQSSRIVGGGHII